MAQGQMPLQATASALGIAVVTYPAIAVGQTLIISQVNVSSTSALASTCQLLLNGIIVAESISGNSDTAAGEPPIEYRAGSQLQVKWSGCTPNTSRCTATFYYDQVTRRSSAI